MRRGETVPAMRHAAEAEELDLVAEIFENAGGLRLWMLEGLLPLQVADRLLSEEALSLRPRLGLARCVVLIMTGRLEAAREMYRSVAADVPRPGCRRGRDRFRPVGGRLHRARRHRAVRRRVDRLGVVAGRRSPTSRSSWIRRASTR